MLNPTTWNLFTLALTGRAAETDPNDLRLLAAVGDEARNDYLRGLSAISNIIFWACENENYTDHKNDLPALSAFLKHTADMARAADFMAGHLEAMADLSVSVEKHAEVNNPHSAPASFPAADEWETVLRGTTPKTAQQEGDSADQYADILKEVTQANQARGANHA